MYTEAIKRGMDCDDSGLKDVCVNILTEYEEYPLSFIEFETDDLLGIKATRADFTEGFVILNKKYISSISVVYKNDIIFTEEDDNVSYN